jgi:uncharacterized protein YdaU (DUF1376 family)
MDKVLNTRITQTVELEERIDSQRLNTVIVMLHRGRLDLNDQSRLGMLLANIQDHANPRFATVYERKLFKYKGEWHSIGRMPPKIKSGGSNELKSGMCATLMQQDLRNLLYLGCVDLDQVCAVQRIACDIFKHFQIPEANWSAVKDYAMNSDAVRASLMEELKVTKKEVKQAFNQLMFGGDSHLCKHSTLLKLFQEQIQMCTAILMRKPELDVFLAYANKRLEEKKKPSKPQYNSDALLVYDDDDEPENLEGVFLAHLVFHCESVATYYMYDYLSRYASDHVRVNTLEYDGLKLALNDEVDPGFLPALITKANWTVQQRSGMHSVEFTDKEMKVSREDYLDAFEECKDHFLPDDEYDAAEKLVERWDGILKANVDGSMMYLRSNGTVWVDGLTGGGFEVENMIRKSKEFMVWKDLDKVRGCETLRKGVQVIVRGELKDPHFEELLHTSTKGKLCYQDGVYDFATRQFKPWGECQDIHSFVTTGIDFPMERPSEERIIEVKRRLVESCFTLWNIDSEDTEMNAKRDALVTLFLERLARAMAGHVEDKVWMLWLGMRNSGKGVIIRMLEQCFGKKYIQNIESGNLFPKDSSQDSAKMLSWIIAAQYARLIYTNEISTEKKADGQMVKKVASGGDDFTARKNYKDEQTVQISGTLAVLCNERPEFTPDDCLQNCQSFLFKGEFKEAADIEKETCEHRRKRMKVADPEIKHGYCSEAETIAAFTYLLFDHYSVQKPCLVDKLLHEEMQEVTVAENSASSIINKWFVFDENGKVFDEDIKKPKDGNGWNRDTEEDRRLMWEELKGIGIKTYTKLRAEIQSKLDGVTTEGLPKELRVAKARGLQGVRFVTSSADQSMAIDMSGGL